MSEEEKVNETEVAQESNTEEATTEVQQEEKEEVSLDFNPEAFFTQEERELTEDNNTEEPNVENNKNSEETNPKTEKARKKNPRRWV